MELYTSANPVSTCSAMSIGKIPDRRSTCIPITSGDSSHPSAPPLSPPSPPPSAAPAAPASLSPAEPTVGAAPAFAPPAKIGLYSKASPSSSCISCDTTSVPAGAPSSRGATCRMGSPMGTCSQCPFTPPTNSSDSAPYPITVCSRSVHPFGSPSHVYSSSALLISRHTAVASAAVSVAEAPSAFTCHTAITASPANLTMSAPCPHIMSIMLPRYSLRASRIRSAPARLVDVEPTRLRPRAYPSIPSPLLHASASVV
mmetsp:Transcript_35411/g.86987  ORF Transcript_35411/g.86987 Transcript_35411/m.86987 type:complete len:257 (-) Transcript_35411:1073-1843(-)